MSNIKEINELLVYLFKRDTEECENEKNISEEKLKECYEQYIDEKKRVFYFLKKGIITPNSTGFIIKKNAEELILNDEETVRYILEELRILSEIRGYYPSQNKFVKKIIEKNNSFLLGKVKK